jgi:hypothetical protein
VRVFYDTEFLEDGRTIELISIGMVAEDGRELYLVNEAIGDDPLYTSIGHHRWLMEFVVPHLPLREATNRAKPYEMPTAQFPGTFRLDHDDNRIVSLRYIRNAVRDFVLDTPEPQLWAWYGAYDHVALAQLFGRMIDLPKGFPMFTCDLKQEAVRLGNPRVPDQESGAHHALADAKHNLHIAQYLDRIQREQP